jgi:ribosomal protein L35
MGASMKKSISKRIRITKNGKVIRRHMGGGHNGTRKGANQKRRITNDGVINSSDTRLIAQELYRTLNLNKASRPNNS